MKPVIILPILLATALIFAGCATQPKEQLAAARAAGISSGLLYKLEHGRCLSPADIIELKRRHVDDAVAIRQLDHHGVDYPVNKDVLSRLRDARVSDAVVDAVISAGRRFREDRSSPYVGIYGYSYPYPYPYPYGYPYGPYDYGYGYHHWHRW